MAEVYCGPATAPQMLFSAWNADIFAIILGVMLVGAYLRSADLRVGNTHTGRAGGNVAFWTGVCLFVLLYISPLCTLTVSLFSARAAHHVLLIGLVAPLLALSFPEGADGGRRISLTLLVALHAGILWLWHVPAVYNVAIATALPYWLMQLSLLGSGFAMWRRILSARTDTGSALLALLATVVQMGMLGALLIFARQPLYEAHFVTTLTYGLPPLADQQLAGLIMWVPAALPYLVAAVLLLMTRFDPSPQADRR